jgi:hypothetical protein
MTTIAASLKYYIFYALVVAVGEKEKEREKKRRKKPRKCKCVRAHTTYTHRIGKKKREKGAVCSLARSSIVRDSFLRASAQAQTAMYVSRWDAGRSMEEKGGEGRGKRESERSKKHRERAHKANKRSCHLESPIYCCC